MDNTKKIPVTEQEKSAQIRKEAKATIALFVICVLWHVGFGFALNNVGVRICNLPLWWWVSTPGVFVVAVAGVAFLLKKVFVNFDLGAEEGADNE